jgi:hypothetical protein
MGLAVSNWIQPESQAVPCVRTISGPRRIFTARAIFVFAPTLLQSDVVIVVRIIPDIVSDIRIKPMVHESKLRSLNKSPVTSWLRCGIASSGPQQSRS